MPSPSSRRSVWILVVMLFAAALSSVPVLPAAAASAGRLAGIVEDETGEPFAGAQVRLLDADGSTAARVTADTHGRYAAAVPTGTYRVEVEGRQDGEPVRARIATVDVGDDSPLDIVIAGGPGQVSRFDGTVTDPDGRPLPNATVRLSSEGATRTVTDERGSFRLDVQSGIYPLRIEGSGPASSHGYTDNVFDLTGDRHERFVLSPTAAATRTAASTSTGTVPGLRSAFGEHIVSGSVVGPGGSPLAGVQVALGPISYSTPYTEADGRYSLSGSAGSTTLSVAWTDGNPDDEYCWSDEDCQGDQYTLAVNGFHPETAPQPLDLTLPPGTFTVRVVDSAGRPVAGAVVTGISTAGPDSPGGHLFPGGPVSGHIRSRHVTAADGTATMAMIPGHAPVLSVDPPSDRGLPASLTPAPDATSAEVRVPGGITLRGSLTDTTGQRAWFFNAGLGSEDGGFRRLFTLSPDRLSYGVIVPAGRYRLWTDTYDNEPGGESDDRRWFDVRSSPFDLSADATINFKLPALSPATLSFVGPRGDPVEGDLGVSATTGAVNLASGIPGTATTRLFVFGATDGAQFSIPGESTVSAHFDAGYPLTLSGLPIRPGGRIIVAEAEGSGLAQPDGPTELRAEQTAPGAATISWTPPVDDHGSPITGYEVALQERGTADRIAALTTTTSIVISGLTPGRSYLVIVSATTRRGTGNGGVVLLTLDSSQPVTGPAPPPHHEAGPASPPSVTTATTAEAHAVGYWALASDGRVYNFGDAPHLGNTTSGAVDLEPTPAGTGYWTLNKNGTVAAFGDATPLGDVDGGKLAKDELPASLSATPTGKGYWIFTNRGRAIAFGDAPHLGDMRQTKLNGPVLGSVATPSGKGYYLVASDGGIFAFGDAAFAGSMGGQKLNAPVQSLVPDSDGKGYWLVASDGGIFAFDAPFRGSMGGTRLNKPVVGMVRYGDGYLMVGADGGIFNFSTSPFAGSLGDKPPASAVVAVAALP